MITFRSLLLIGLLAGSAHFAVAPVMAIGTPGDTAVGASTLVDGATAKVEQQAATTQPSRLLLAVGLAESGGETGAPRRRRL